jgi:uncharacterized membrane protein required for colicin V production
MNILDAFLSGIIGLQVIVGFVKGFLNKAVEMGILLASAAAAYLYYKKGGSLLKITLVFVLAQLLLHMVFWLVRKFVLKDKAKPSLYLRVGGGIIGACEGVVLVLVALVFLHFSSGILGSANTVLTRTLETSLFYTRFRAISRQSAVPGVQEAYKIVEALNAGDGKIKLDEKTVNKLRENHSIQAILGDEKLLESIRQRNYTKILSNPKFVALLNDRELLKQLAAMGLKENNTAIAEEAPVQVEVPVLKQTENCLVGIVHNQGSAAAVINDQIYKIGSQVLGGRIVEINSNGITMEFPDGRRQYSVGKVIP